MSRRCDRGPTGRRPLAGHLGGADEILVHPLDPVTAAGQHRRAAASPGRRVGVLRSPITAPGERHADSWPGLLTRLLDGEHLEGEDTGWVMDRIMSGEATSAQVAGFAVALRAKGETPPRSPVWSTACWRTPCG